MRLEVIARLAVVAGALYGGALACNCDEYRLAVSLTLRSINRTSLQALPHLDFVGSNDSLLQVSSTVATLMALSLSYMLPAFASALAEEKHKGLYQLQRTSGLQRLAFVMGHYG